MHKQTKLIGRRIQEVRTQRGMSSTVLAEKVGISQAQICRLENSKQGFRSETLAKIADALGVPMAELMVEAADITASATAARLKGRPELLAALADARIADAAVALAKLKKTCRRRFNAIIALLG